MIDSVLLNPYQNLFTKPAFEAFGNYIRALSGEMRSFSVLGFTDLYGLDYDQHDYFISRGRWDERKVNRMRVTFHIGALAGRTFDIVIDDSSMRKFTNVPFFVAKGYIGNLGKVDQCISAVFSVLADSSGVIPLDLEPYLHACKLFCGRKDQEFRSKLDLAVSLIQRACFLARELNFTIGYALFDTWYAASWFLNLLDQGRLKYVTEVRNNRSLEDNKGWVAVKSFVTANPRNPETVIYQGQSYEIRAFAVKFRGLEHTVKLFEVRGKFCGKREIRYFITNDIELTTQQALIRILRRWDIDYFFREAKAYLMLDEGKYQKLRCYIRHFYLCLVAWSMIRVAQQRAMLGGSVTIFQAVRWLRKNAG